METGINTHKGSRSSQILLNTWFEMNGSHFLSIRELKLVPSSGLRVAWSVFSHCLCAVSSAK